MSPLEGLIMLHRLVLITLCTLLLTVPQVGSAKSISRILATSGLEPEDFLTMGSVARSLYDTANPQVGASKTWVNDETGSKGSVKLESFKDGCAVLLHTVQAASKPSAVPIPTKQCRTAEGTWQLSD